MNQNIWEIVVVNDLVKILKKNENKFVIVALTLQDTPNDVIKVIKKFLKDSAKIYKNLTFMYLQVSDKDLGRISIIKKDRSEYPYIYHIYNITDIFVSVNRANKKTIYESMTAVEEYYKKDMENKLNPTQPEQDNSEEIQNNDKTNENDFNQNIINDEEAQRKVIEHENLLNKIIIFEEQRKKHNIKFLEDIQKRKKDEQKK